MAKIVATKRQTTGTALPDPSEWEKASPICFCGDWRGRNEDPQRETQARILWSFDSLFIQFQCRYRDILVYEGQNNRKDQLWLRDVAEVFLQTGIDERSHYREFEISPNGNWLDLDIAPGRKTHLFWGLENRVIVNPNTKMWTGELAIPMLKIAPTFHPNEIWRINLFRIEGPEPNRFYSAWQPTYTEKANFHVPECFGELHFE